MDSSPPLSRWRWVLLGSLLLVFASVLIVVSSVPPEPLYRDKPLSDYLGPRGQGAKPDPRDSEAQQALKATVDLAIPFLLSMLQTRDSSLRARLARWSRRQSAFKIYIRNQQAYEARNRAAQALALLGADAQPAVPRLSKLIQRHEYAQDVTYALVHIGTPEALNAARSALTNRDAQVRQAVTSCLGAVGRRSGPLLPQLLHRLADGDALVRENAIRTLGNLGAEASLVVPALAERLGDPEPAVCRAAADALCAFGLEARPAAASLTNAWLRADGTTRLALQRAMTCLGAPASR